MPHVRQGVYARL